MTLETICGDGICAISETVKQCSADCLPTPTEIFNCVVDKSNCVAPQISENLQSIAIFVAILLLVWYMIRRQKK